MENSMQDILEMHSKISNDPWINHRRVRDQQERELRQCNADRRTKQNLGWYSKSNTNAQMDRFQWMQQNECEMLKNIQAKETEAKILKNNEQMENIIGKYMENEKNKIQHRDRYSQYLRENNPELRVLASQLREAYVGKIRLAQIDEKEKEKKKLIAADAPFIREMEKLKKAEEEQEKLNMLLEEEKKYNFRKQLERQMKEKAHYDSLFDSREDDKQRIEAIIKDNMEKIQEEHEKERQKKIALKKSYHETFKARASDLLKEKERLLLEEEKLKLFTKSTDQRNESKLQLKQLREENLNRIQMRLGELVSQRQKDIDEFEAARQDVAIAQAEMQAFRHEKTERDNKEKAKIEYVAELNKFKVYSKQAEEEIQLKDKKLEMEIEKVTKLKDEEMRLKKLREHELNEKFKYECQADIKEKQLEKERCMEVAKQMEKSFTMDNIKYDEDVERERNAMIKEMAQYLYPGCIPRGMLKEKDIQYLDDPLKNFLLSKKSYPDTNLN